MSIPAVVRLPVKHAVLAFAIASAIGGSVVGQSSPCAWNSDPGVPGFENAFADAWVMSSIVYDDGNGPALYAGGAFTSAGGVAAGGLARWDGARWQPVGDGVLGYVAALAVFEDGSGTKLVAGGAFGLAGTPGIHNVAAWDGKTWSALGDGLVALGGSPGLQWIRSLAVFDDGSGPQLYAGTNFDIWNVPGAKRLARYDGTQWNAVPGDPMPWGQPFNTAEVMALIAFDDGNGPALYVGGDDTSNALTLTRFDGTSWTSVGPTQGQVNAFAVHDDGGGAALYVCGFFSQIAGVPIANLARWDGSSWTALNGTPVGSDDEIACFATHVIEGLPQLVVGMREHGSDTITGRLLAWDGATLDELPASITANEATYLPWSITTIASAPMARGSTLFVAGQFTEVDDVAVNNAAFWRMPTLGDLDCDGLVDAADLGLLLAAWATSDAAADLDSSGVVDGGDLGTLLGNWS